MNTKTYYRINSGVKEEYDSLIEKKHGNKHTNCGKNVESLIKLFLTVNGGSDYGDDPDVREMIRSIREDAPCTHTS